MTFEGHFETHITLAATDDPPSLLRGLDMGRQMKFVHIILDQGQTTSQPMLTIEGTGTLADQLAEARAFADELRGRGLQVTRIKIEAAPANRDVPQSEADAVRLPPDLHFEHHVKLLLDGSDAIAPLQLLVAGHDARLSRNARRTRDDGRLERFVTQRIFGVGLTKAQNRLANLVAALEKKGYKILDTEAEYVVFDSNQNLDAGWIETRMVST